MTRAARTGRGLAQADLTVMRQRPATSADIPGLRAIYADAIAACLAAGVYTAEQHGFSHKASEQVERNGVVVERFFVERRATRSHPEGPRPGTQDNG